MWLLEAAKTGLLRILECVSKFDMNEVPISTRAFYVSPYLTYWPWKSAESCEWRLALRLKLLIKFLLSLTQSRRTSPAWLLSIFTRFAFLSMQSITTSFALVSSKVLDLRGSVLAFPVRKESRPSNYSSPTGLHMMNANYCWSNDISENWNDYNFIDHYENSIYALSFDLKHWFQL